MEEKPKVIIKPNNTFYTYKHVIQLCSNCFHDHQSQNICLEGGTCKCSDGDGKELGEYANNSNKLKELLSHVEVVDKGPLI